MKDPDQAPRIHDVAKLAGVSVATVSRVLSNPSIVAERTRIAVEKAVAETGYTVNVMARNLRQQQVGGVLALVPNLANPFFSAILAGIADALREEGLSLLVLDTRRADTGSATGGIRSYLTRSRADGLIVLDGSLDPALFSQPSCPPVVQACEWIDGLAGPRVLADNEAGARLAVEHLLGLGHRRIMHVTGPMENTLSQSRAAGVAQARSARWGSRRWRAWRAPLPWPRATRRRRR